MRSEDLGFVRLMMVISSLAPLFAIWAIRGMQPIPDEYLVPSCAAFIIIPNSVLALRWIHARRAHDTYTVSVVRFDDHRDHLLVYLFAVLLPLFDANIGRPRDSAATLTALVFIIYLFGI